MQENQPIAETEALVYLFVGMKEDLRKMNVQIGVSINALLKARDLIKEGMLYFQLSEADEVVVIVLLCDALDLVPFSIRDLVMGLLDSVVFSFYEGFKRVRVEHYVGSSEAHFRVKEETFTNDAP